MSPLIDYSTAAQGYILQFNQVQPLLSRTVGLSPPNTAPTAPVGQIILWQAQVAVLLKDSSNAALYQQLLVADCLSQTTGAIVDPCSGTSAPSTQAFAVWERQPSSVMSDYWSTIPNVKIFTQMYTTDPILVLTNGFQTNTQYYVCGS